MIIKIRQYFILINAKKIISRRIKEINIGIMEIIIND